MDKKGNSEFQKKLNDLQRAFTTADVSESLAKVLLSKLYEMNANSAAETSCADGFYLQQVMNELIDASLKPGFTEQEIDRVLITINFNFRGFFANYLLRLSERVQREDTLTGKLETLAFERKEVNQIIAEKDLRYTDKCPSMKEIVVGWISDEVAYWERKSSLLQMMATQTGTIFKIALDLSVAQLACLSKAFRDSGIFLTDNISELSRVFARTFVTKRAETISDKNFQRKYYNIEANTRLSLIERLNGVIDWLKKETDL
jgi:hypothetical protein